MYSEKELNLAYKEAIEFTKNHYENFPVISFFVPKHLQKHIAVIYKFARQADDLADEGEVPAEQRLEQLESYQLQLNNCLLGNFVNPFWLAVKRTIDSYNLSSDNFLKLLSAFKQDVIKKRYDTFDDLLDYCCNSADPVGRLILELNGIHDDNANYFSDKICTALQLTNFYQDLGKDKLIDRIYIPIDEMEKFGVAENEFDKKENNDKFRLLVKYQVDRVKQLFAEGRNLFDYLNGVLKYQIAWTVLGGETILNKIERLNYDTRIIRPVINKFDVIKLIAKSWTI